MTTYTLDRETFEELVSDFECGIIDSYSIGDSHIEWQERDQTCWEIVDGEVVATGSFERLLEWFLEDEETFCINHGEHFTGTHEQMIAHVRANYSEECFCCVYDIKQGHDWGIGPDSIFEEEAA